MGLFPDSQQTGALLETVVGTPKGRRKLFVDIFSVVAGSSTTMSSAPILNGNQTSNGFPYRDTDGFMAATSAASSSLVPNHHGTVGRYTSGSQHSGQQLSTSWEFLRWVNDIFFRLIAYSFLSKFMSLTDYWVENYCKSKIEYYVSDLPLYL